MLNQTRRDFLRQTATTAVVTMTGAVPVAKGVDGPGPRSRNAEMRLGLVTYNWGRTWDLSTCIKNCEATGFVGLELRSTHQHGVEVTLNKVERKDVAKQFSDSPVELAGLGSACEYHSPEPAVLKKNIEETKAFVRMCHDVGGGGVKVRPNGLPKGVPVQRTLEQIGASLNEVSRYAEGYGVEIRLEVHGRGTNELPHIKTIMDVADSTNAGVCWNCNQQDLKGGGLQHNFNLVKDRISTIHIHDLRKNNYPWRKLFGLLKETDFSGWTLLEDGEPPMDIIQSMRENRQVWEELVSPV